MENEIRIPELANKIEDLHRHFWDTLRDLIRGELGFDLLNCTGCGKPILPRRVYDRLDKDTKQKIRGFILKCHARQVCSSCQTVEARTMTTEEIEQLRRTVGA